MAVRRGAPSILDSFNFAFEGIIHVLRTQRNMRIHFSAAVAVLVAAVATGVSRLELIALLLSIAFVLIATVNAVAVGYLVFSGQIADASTRLLDRLADAPAELSLVALVLTILLVIASKALTGRGRPLRGGLPSGHAAVAFAIWMAVTLIVDAHRFLVSSLVLIGALLVAQTRVESGIHSALEVFYGALLGSITALAVIQVLG